MPTHFFSLSPLLPRMNCRKIEDNTTVMSDSCSMRDALQYKQKRRVKFDNENNEDDGVYDRP